MGSGLNGRALRKESRGRTLDRGGHVARLRNKEKISRVQALGHMHCDGAQVAGIRGCEQWASSEPIGL